MTITLPDAFTGRAALLSPDDSGAIGEVLRDARRGTHRNLDFAIPGAQTQIITDSVFASSGILSRVRRYRVTTRGLVAVLPDEAAGGDYANLEFSHTAEGEEYPSTLLKMRAAQPALRKDGCVVFASADLVEDSDADRFIASAAVRAIQRRMERRIVRGLGGGEPLGIANASATIVQAIESGQDIANTALHITTNSAKMVAQLLDLDSAVALVNPDLLTSLITATTNGNARDLITPPDAGAPFGRLATRPLVPNYAAPRVGQVGDLMFASLADYVVITMGDLKTDMSIHVRFLPDENAYRFSMRWDGQPMLGRPFVPEWSAAEKSHYVALAARS